MCSIFSLGCSNLNSRRLAASSLPFTQQSCNNPGICPDGTVKSVCTWNKFYAATAFDPAATATSSNIGGSSYSGILFCTNSMPNHCYVSPTQEQRPIQNPDESSGYACFTATFNVPPSALYAAGSFATSLNTKVQTTVNSAMCDSLIGQSLNINTKLALKAME